MAKGNVAKLVRDNARHFISRHLPRPIFIKKTARDEDTSIGGRKTVHRLNLVDVDLDTFKVEGFCHLVT